MDLKEIRKQKETLEGVIKACLIHFKQESGVEVQAIDVIYDNTYSSSNLRINVELESI